MKPPTTLSRKTQTQVVFLLHKSSEKFIIFGPATFVRSFEYCQRRSMILEALLSTLMDVVVFHPSFAAMILLLVIVQVLLLTATGLMVSFSSCCYARTTPCTSCLVPTFKNGMLLAETECEIPASFANVLLLDGLAFKRFRQLGVVLHKPPDLLSSFKQQWQLGLFTIYQPIDAISLQPFGPQLVSPPPARCQGLSKATSNWLCTCPPMGRTSFKIIKFDLIKRIIS